MHHRTLAGGTAAFAAHCLLLQGNGSSTAPNEGLAATPVTVSSIESANHLFGAAKHQSLS
jgi:hypothetical protein